MLEIARSQLGVPYNSMNYGPAEEGGEGFGCAMFVSYVYNNLLFGGVSGQEPGGARRALVHLSRRYGSVRGGNPLRAVPCRGIQGLHLGPDRPGGSLLPAGNGDRRQDDRERQIMNSSHAILLYSY